MTEKKKKNLEKSQINVISHTSVEEGQFKLISLGIKVEDAGGRSGRQEEERNINP